MQIITQAIEQITRKHVWIGSLLKRMQIEYDTMGIPTMATNGKQVIINSDFANSLPAAEVRGVLVHEALHVINRHPLRRGDRDPQAFNIACDHAINGIVHDLGYQLPDSGLEPWSSLTGKDETAEQIYAQVWPEMEEKRQEQMEQLTDALNEAMDQQPQESGDTEAEGDSTSDGTDDSTASNSDDSGESDPQSGDSSESGESEAADGSGESGVSGDSGDFGPTSDGAGEPSSDANSECNSGSGENGDGSGSPSESEETGPVEGSPGDANEQGGADLMDYPLEEGQTMADAERELDTLIAKAKMDAVLSCGHQPAQAEQHIFERKDSSMDWIKELEEYMQQLGGSDYSMAPPNRRLASAGIIANRLNPAGCGNVVMVVDTSGSIDTDQLNLVLTNLELFMENIDFESLRVIACSSRVTYDETFMRGQMFDISRMPIGGGTKFSPAFDLVDEGAEPDLLIYFSDMQVYTESAPLDPPSYPVLWVTDNAWCIDKETHTFKDDDSRYWFRPDWGDIICTEEIED